MLGRSARTDGGYEPCGRRSGRHQGHRHDVGHRGNHGGRNGRAMHMQHGVSVVVLVIVLVIVVARCGIPIVMMLMRDMRRITMRMGVDLDPRDIGQSDAQRQHHHRKKADRLATPAVQPHAEKIQIHSRRMPQLVTILNTGPLFAALH